MLLAVDAGNTNVVFALVDGGEIRARWRIATDPRRTADEYAVWLSQLLALEPVPGFVVHGAEGSFLKSRADVQADMLDRGISPNVADWGQEPVAEHGVLHTCVDGRDERRR